jgi:hypothetical protein
VPSEILRAPIDYMFVDNTYCNAAYRHPTRIKATEEVSSRLLFLNAAPLSTPPHAPLHPLEASLPEWKRAVC